VALVWPRCRVQVVAILSRARCEVTSRGSGWWNTPAPAAAAGKDGRRVSRSSPDADHEAPAGVRYRPESAGLMHYSHDARRREPGDRRGHPCMVGFDPIGWVAAHIVVCRAMTHKNLVVDRVAALGRLATEPRLHRERGARDAMRGGPREPAAQGNLTTLEPLGERDRRGVEECCRAEAEIGALRGDVVPEGSRELEPVCTQADQQQPSAIVSKSEVAVVGEDDLAGAALRVADPNGAGSDQRRERDDAPLGMVGRDDRVEIVRRGRDLGVDVVGRAGRRDRAAGDRQRGPERAAGRLVRRLDQLLERGSFTGSSMASSFASTTPSGTSTIRPTAGAAAASPSASPTASCAPAAGR